jgi:thymidylate kinase
MEQKGDSYHQRVREGFLQLAKQQENFLVVDAAGEVETVHKNILQLISEARFMP